MSNTMIFKKFKDLGFSTNEAKSYLSLLERDTLSVTEVAKLAKIPRSNTYEALESLSAKGLCVSIPGKIIQYTASDPQILKGKAIEITDYYLQDEIEKHERKKKEILSRNKDILEKADQIIKEIKPRFNKSRNDDSPLNFIKICKDRRQAPYKFSEVILDTKKEFLNAEKPFKIPPPPPDEEAKKWVTFFTKKVVELMKKGVDCRGVYELSEESERRARQIQYLQQYVDHGEKIRIAKEVPMKFSTIDSRVAIITIEDQNAENPPYVAQIIHHEGMAKALKMTFETLWNNSEDFNDVAKREAKNKKG